MTKKVSGTIAEQLTALIEYRNRPNEVLEPLKSNWTLVPANDNATDDEVADFGFERHLRMTPSVQEIMRQVNEGQVEYGEVAPPVKNRPIPKRGKVLKIGNLKFSDGTQTEKAFMRGPDGETVQFDRPMPLGAMLKTREKAEGPAGGKGYTAVDLQNSNKFYAMTFGTDMPRFIKRTERRNGPSLTAEQSAANLAKAITNTQVMPPVTKCPTALPCGSERVSDSFLAFKKVSSGLSGSVAWEDIGQTIENAKVWKNLRKALKSDDVAVLDAAMQAQTYGDLDLTGGAHKRTLERRGKRRLVAANDNLAAALKKFAS